MRGPWVRALKPLSGPSPDGMAAAPGEAKVAGEGEGGVPGGRRPGDRFSEPRRGGGGGAARRGGGNGGGPSRPSRHPPRRLRRPMGGAESPDAVTAGQWPAAKGRALNSKSGRAMRGSTRRLRRGPRSPLTGTATQIRGLAIGPRGAHRPQPPNDCEGSCFLPPWT